MEMYSFSQERTTQGDPLAMPMYALATIRKLKTSVSDVNHVWYADGQVSHLREWWDQINALGPKFGYFTNARKIWLVTKEECCSAAVAAFADTGVRVTSEGRPYLGAALGTEEYMQVFDQLWTGELAWLATIACSQSHATHAAFTHGMTSKWTYLTRTMPGTGPCLAPPETIIKTKLIPALTGRPPPDDTERDLLALPARLGGIALVNPSKATDAERLSSITITEALTNAIQIFSILMKLLPANSRQKHKLKREQATNATEKITYSLV